MTKYKELSSLKNVSIFLIALPYLCFNYENIINSPFYSTLKLTILLFCILLIDILIKAGIMTLNEKIKTPFTLLISFAITLFFYGLYITNFIQNEIQIHLLYLIRARSIIKIMIGFFIILTIIVRKKSLNYQYSNAFLIIFSTITILNSTTKYIKSNQEEFESSFVSIPLENRLVKPILLIISDEYSSPDCLYKLNKDSNIYNFSKKLISKGWITKNSFYSYETSTIHSLASLFNFNLSKNKKFSKQKINKIGANQLLNAKIADSLKNKGVEIINYGIFHIGKHSYLNRLYHYPTSFIEDIILNTIIYTVKTNTGNLKIDGFKNSYHPSEDHNKYIFNNLLDTLNKINNKKVFVYIHLYMPHSPMQFNPEFSLRSVNNVINYRDYWNFTNAKLNDMLTTLIKENKYRIILTGDHGYRGDIDINPKNTFIGYFGFEKNQIDKIKSVQDLGSLINNEF